MPKFRVFAGIVGLVLFSFLGACFYAMCGEALTRHSSPFDPQPMAWSLMGLASWLLSLCCVALVMPYVGRG